MKPELIIISEYCVQSQLEPDFIIQLEEEGLIEISVVDDERYIDLTQLGALERYARMHYDLSINVEGISVIQQLLDRINGMQDEILRLKEQLTLLD